MLYSLITSWLSRVIFVLFGLALFAPEIAIAQDGSPIRHCGQWKMVMGRFHAVKLNSEASVSSMRRKIE